VYALVSGDVYPKLPVCLCACMYVCICTGHRCGTVSSAREPCDNIHTCAEPATQCTVHSLQGSEDERHAMFSFKQLSDAATALANAVAPVPEPEVQRRFTRSLTHLVYSALRTQALPQRPHRTSRCTLPDYVCVFRAHSHAAGRAACGK
jgi:hypothetical protein